MVPKFTLDLLELGEWVVDPLHQIPDGLVVERVEVRMRDLPLMVHVLLVVLTPVVAEVPEMVEHPYKINLVPMVVQEL